MEILQPQSPFHELHHWGPAPFPTSFNPMLMNANQYVPGPRSARKRQDGGPEIVSIKRRRAPSEIEVAQNVTPAPTTPAPAAINFPPPQLEESTLPATVPALFEPIPGNPYQIRTLFPMDTFFGSFSAPTTVPAAPVVEVVLDDGVVATPLKRITIAPALEFAPTLRKQLRRSTPIIDIPPALSLPPSSTALIPRPELSRLFALPSPTAFPAAKPRTWSIEEVVDEEEETNTNATGAQTHQQPIQSQVMSVD
jgi:hypothetical protein